MEASVLRAPRASTGLGRLPVPTALLRLRSDEQLVALFRAGDEGAFRVIHDRYRVRLLAYARQMLGGSRTDAEDALQDVFLRAYHALRADDRPIALRAWLYRVAHNRCIDHLRRPVPREEDVLDVSRTPTADPLAETERRDDLRRLVADVRRLPEHQRSALLMRELEGLSYADLATALDVTVPAVKSLLVRARMGLAEAQEARDTACADIREELAASSERGGRPSGRSRRHVRECAGCEQYRTALRGVSAGLHSLAPGGGPLALLAQLLGLGGAGSAAGGAGAAAVGGGGAAAAAGGATIGATTAKVAAVVASAAIAAGGAAEVRHAVETKRDRGAAAAERAGAGGAARAPVLRAIGASVAGPAVVAPVARAAALEDAPRAAPSPSTAVAEREAPAERAPAAAVAPATTDDAATVDVGEETVVLGGGETATDAPAVTGGAPAPGEDGAAGPGEPESATTVTPAGAAVSPAVGTTAGAGAVVAPAPGASVGGVGPASGLVAAGATGSGTPVPAAAAAAAPSSGA